MITLKEEHRRIIIVIMEKTSVDTNDVSEDMDVAAMDKECSALSALFQQIINEMKVCHIIFFHFRIFRYERKIPIYDRCSSS